MHLNFDLECRLIQSFNRGKRKPTWLYRHESITSEYGIECRF